MEAAVDTVRVILWQCEESKMMKRLIHTAYVSVVLPQKEKGSDKDAAARVGALVAQRAIEKGVKDVIFDRGGYLYHGRVKALADAAREAGLNF